MISAIIGGGLGGYLLVKVLGPWGILAAFVWGMFWGAFCGKNKLP